MLNRAQFLEPTINKEASSYIENNYNEILIQAKKMGVHEDKVGDLVNDVYFSIVQAENEGNGYDFNKGENGTGILVEQFVYGRISRYAKNIKYRTDIVEKVGKAGFVISSSSSSEDEIDQLSSFQKAFALASKYDDLDFVDEELSIREIISYCLSFDSQVNMSMSALFRNIDILGNMEINKSLFDPLKAVISENREFAEAFRNAIEFSMKDKLSFERILNSLERVSIA